MKQRREEKKIEINYRKKRDYVIELKKVKNWHAAKDATKQITFSDEKMINVIHIFSNNKYFCVELSYWRTKNLKSLLFYGVFSRAPLFKNIKNVLIYFNLQIRN